MPLKFSKRIIIYTIDTKKEIYILNFSKIQYLPNYSINIFGARKLLNRSIGILALSTCTNITCSGMYAVLKLVVIVFRRKGLL